MPATIGQILKNKGNTVYTATPEDSVYKALQCMAENDIGAVVIVENNEPAGIFTERDYARKVILQHKSSKATRIEEIMTSDLVMVTPDDRVRDCLSTMNNMRIRHLPVMENDQLVGIISIGDLVNAIIHEQQSTIEQLENYIASG